MGLGDFVNVNVFSVWCYGCLGSVVVKVEVLLFNGMDEIEILVFLCK